MSPWLELRVIVNCTPQIRLDHLRDEALAHIWNNLSEHNILEELSCSLVSRSVFHRRVACLLTVKLIV